MPRHRSITKPEQRLATIADLQAVVDAAAMMIASLEARIVALEPAVFAEMEPPAPMDDVPLGGA